MPFIQSTNSPITSAFSGLPKFKQLVIARGFAPTDIKFLQFSATICFPPVFGSALQYKADESTDTAIAFSLL